MKLTTTQCTELEDIRAENGGALTAQDVLDRARSANSSLHPLFTWNDDAAAEKWRLAQASQVIRAVVVYEPAEAGHRVAVRAFVPSIHGGYRAIATVLDDEADATALFARARDDIGRAIGRWQRYAALRPALAAALKALDTHSNQETPDA